ncbi:MAG: hypothetical protein EOO40_03505 [Deltaproteobacteria bacterium]|nr:MAG: hypothetical protein EOO40_03505 [Deltaproteobacteria bacterium]
MPSYSHGQIARLQKLSQYRVEGGAELAQANGFEYFALQSESDLTDFRDVQVGQEQTQVQGQEKDNYAGVRTFSAMVTTTHPSHIIFNRHSSAAIMRGFKEGTQPLGALEVATILSNFEDK